MSETLENKKRILFMLPRLYPGGAERVLITLMNNLDRKKYDIQFVSLAGEGTIKHWIDSDITVHALQKKRITGSIIALYKKIKDLQPDTVVTTMIHSNAGLLLLRPFFPKIKFIVRESSLPVALIKEYGWKGKLCKLIYKFLYPFADYVISPAKVIIKEFEQDIKIKTFNHKTLYNPVNERRLHATISHFEEGDNNRETTQRFICVGRLGFEKGYDRLIKALENYKPDNEYDWRLDIIGKGAEIKNLGDLIRSLNLKTHVKLAGYHNIPWPLMAEADCLLLPSRWEGMPNVALEALSCGINVIAHSQAGGISEISAMAAQGNVKVVDDMQEFVNAMKEVKPQKSKLPILSKLPEEFRLQNVINNFEKII